MDRPSVVWPRASFHHVAALLRRRRFARTDGRRGSISCGYFIVLGECLCLQINVAIFHFVMIPALTRLRGCFLHVGHRLAAQADRPQRQKDHLASIAAGTLPIRGAITASVDFSIFRLMWRKTIACETLAVMKSCIAPYREWELQMERLLDDRSEAALSNTGRFGA